MQEVFRFQRTGLAPDGKIIGHFHRLRRAFALLRALPPVGYDLPASIYEPIAAE